MTLLEPYTGEVLSQGEVDETGHFVTTLFLAEGNFIVAVCREGGILATQKEILTMFFGRDPSKRRLRTGSNRTVSRAFICIYGIRRAIGITLFGLLPLLPAQDAYPPGLLYSEAVRVRVVDSFGNSLPFRVAEFKGRTSGARDRSEEFQGGVLRHVPSDEYEYRIVSEQLIPGALAPYFEEKGTFVVNHNIPGHLMWKESLFVVEARLGRLSNSGLPAVSLSGSVIGLPPHSWEKTWVTLMAPFDGKVWGQSSVDQSGHFAIENIASQGHFILAACADGAILATRTVRIDGTQFGPADEVRANIMIPAPSAGSKVRAPWFYVALGAVSSAVLLLLGGFVWRRIDRRPA